LALAKAIKDGSFGVMDYYNMKNILADTSMRDSISKINKTDDDTSINK